jgi:hypothetical protein
MHAGVSGLRLIEAGMDVRDIDGIKMGTVNRILGSAAPHGDVFEVKTGLLGLGRPLYVPVTLVQGVTGRSVFCWRTRDRIVREYRDAQERLC